MKSDESKWQSTDIPFPKLVRPTLSSKGLHRIQSFQYLENLPRSKTDLKTKTNYARIF